MHRQPFPKPHYPPPAGNPECSVNPGPRLYTLTELWSHRTDSQLGLNQAAVPEVPAAEDDFSEFIWKEPIMPHYATTGFLAPSSISQHYTPVSLGSLTGQYPLLKDGGFHIPSLLCARTQGPFLSLGSHSYVRKFWLLRSTYYKHDIHI